MTHPNNPRRGISPDAGNESEITPPPTSGGPAEKGKGDHELSPGLKDSSESAPLSIPGRENEEAKVKALFGQWLDLRRRSLAIAMELGCILAGLKAELKTAKPSRLWEPYVETCLGIHPRTASNYMRIWKEARALDQNGNDLPSEIVSEKGVREMLDFLAETRKDVTNDTESSKSSKSSRENKTADSGKSHGDPRIHLADGSRMDMKHIHWSDGLITRKSLESWVMRVVPDAQGEGEQKLTARRQRAVIHIAAGINRACGTADSSSAAELVESAFEVILSMLREDPIGESINGTLRT